MDGYSTEFLTNVQQLQYAMASGEAAEIRREYQRQRRIAQKRLTRLGKSEYKTSAAYRENVGKFPSLRELKTPGQIARAMREVAAFNAAKSSTITGQRQIEAAKIESLHNVGMDFVNKSNIKLFGDFMDIYREMGLNRVYDSGGSSVENIFKEVSKGKGTPLAIRRAFAKYLRQQGINPDEYLKKKRK